MKKRILSIVGGRGNGKEKLYKEMLEKNRKKRIGQNDQCKDITNTEEYIEFVTNSFYADGKEKGNE